MTSMQIKRKKEEKNFIVRLQPLLPSLTNVERRIADYITSNADKAVACTIEQLAECTHSSYASVNRFCRKLGYSGYRDFQLGLISYLTNEHDITDIAQTLAIQENSSLEEICNNVSQLALRVLDNTFSLIDPVVLTAVANRFVSSRKIFFIGIGNSGLTSQYACNRFFRLGLDCQYYSDIMLARMQAALLQKEDTLFAVSSSGRTAQIVEIASSCRKNGLIVIGLSDFCVSPLSKVCNYNLFTTGRNAQLSPDMDMQFLTGQIALIDILYLYCSNLMGQPASKNYSRTLEQSNNEKI